MHFAVVRVAIPASGDQWNAARLPPSTTATFPCRICPTAPSTLEDLWNPRGDEKQVTGVSEHCVLYSKRCLSASVEILNLLFMCKGKASAAFLLSLFPSVAVRRRNCSLCSGRCKPGAFLCFLVLKASFQI